MKFQFAQKTQNIPFRYKRSTCGSPCPGAVVYGQTMMVHLLDEPPSPFAWLDDGSKKGERMKDIRHNYWKVKDEEKFGKTKKKKKDKSKRI